MKPYVYPARIAIIGSPRAGKTTLALRLGAELGVPVVHSDNLIPLGWSEASEEIARRMLAGAPCVYEGVAVVRALRKLLLRCGPEYEPVPLTQCSVLEHPLCELSMAQDSMRRGCATILSHIEPELVRRGIPIVRERAHHDRELYPW